MVSRDDYMNAKKKLADLRAEEHSLPILVSAAAIGGDTAEVARLRGRKAELSGEIAEAELNLVSLNVARLRAAQAERLKLHEQEQAMSKATDARVSVEVARLDAERKRLMDESQAGLVRVYRLRREMQQGALELQAAEQELKQRLGQVI